MHRTLSALCCALTALVGCGDGPTDLDGPADPPPAISRQCSGSLCLALIAEGLMSPSHVTSPRGDDRIFVIQLGGSIEVFRGTQRHTYLDLSSEVLHYLENGLLGMAFHPDFESNGRFFLHYTNLEADNVVEEFTVDPRERDADGASRRVIKTVDQPRHSNHHKSGHLAFGPDGNLWISVGDGGTLDNAQRLGDLRGSILRVDVDTGDPFGIPGDNPFLGDPAAHEEIYHYGLRNPWRFSIDEASGLLFIADVGANLWEEINVVPYDDGGHNFGWPIREGPDCLGDPQCPSDGLTPPVFAIAHAEDPVCAIIGGIVYRGTGVPALDGRYVFADACAGLRTASFDASGVLTDVSPWLLEDIVGPGMADLVSFGTGPDGEIYTVAVNTGELYRIEAAP